MTHPIKYIAKFFGLILLQVLIIDRIQLGAASPYFTPFIYPLFILTLPITMSPWTLMLLAFITGVTIDLFEDTIGMHASSMVVLAFFRPYILNLLAPREGFDATKEPSIFSMETNRFIAYILLLLFIFHLWFFTLEILRFSGFHITLLKAVISTLSGTILILLLQFLTIKK